MRSLAFLAALLGLLSSCAIVFDDDGRQTQCDLAEPAVAPAPLRNPEDLTCQSFGPGFECPPGCPCPEFAEDLPTDQANLEPPPTWGSCHSLCQELSESACVSDARCRVVKDAGCGRTSECLTDYLGCFPTDVVTRPALDCFSARDGQTCSQSSACTAYHRIDRGTSPELAVPFAMCAPEGKSPGTCSGEVTCDRAVPSCPPNSRPGIAEGCYTGGCIPVDLCEPVAQLSPSPWRASPVGE